MPTFEEIFKNLILTVTTVIAGKMYNNFKAQSFTVTAPVHKVTHKRRVELKKWFDFSFYTVAFFLYCYTATMPKGQRIFMTLLFLFILLILNGSFYELMDYAADNVNTIAYQNTPDTESHTNDTNHI